MRTIQQAQTFATTPDALFDLYMDSKLHERATGGKAKLGKRAGDAFSVHDGYVTGRNVAVVPKRLVVQTWRGADWAPEEGDSLLILSFAAEAGRKARVDLVHLHVPESHAQAIEVGWEEFYWNPWRVWLAGPAKRAPAKKPAKNRAR